MNRVTLVLFLGGCAFAGGAFGLLVSPKLAPRAAAQSSNFSPVYQASTGSEVHQLGNRFEEVALRIAPAVVAVEASKPSAPPSASGRGRTLEESGSGVILRADDQRGYLVVTNNHVISQARPGDITVSAADGRVFHPARVWADPESDVAILRLENVDFLPTVRLGDSDRVRVGQWVLAFGSPFGLNQTVTHGIISARERGQISLGSTIRIKDFLQTDAAINPGSSGGPLVNLEGEVVGINTAIASNNGNSSGVAFSIPVNLVKRVMRELLEKGYVTRGYLGLQTASAFEPNDALKLGLERAQGALVETPSTSTCSANCAGPATARSRSTCTTTTTPPKRSGRNCSPTRNCCTAGTGCSRGTKELAS